MMESATIDCKLCGMKMRVGQGLAQVNKHNEKAHDIFYNKELCLAISLLTEEEIQTLIQKVKPRVEQLDTVGIVTDQKNIFEVEKRETRNEPKCVDIEEIQNLLVDDNSDDDSENELEEESEVKAIEYTPKTPQVKPSSVKLKRLSDFEIKKSCFKSKIETSNNVMSDIEINKSSSKRRTRSFYKVKNDLKVDLSVKLEQFTDSEINKSSSKSQNESSKNDVKIDSSKSKRSKNDDPNIDAAQMILGWLDDSDSDSEDKSASLVNELESLLDENPSMKKRKAEDIINEDHEDIDTRDNKKLKVFETKTAEAAVKTGKKGRKEENNKIDDFIFSLQSQRQVGQK